MAGGGVQRGFVVVECVGCVVVVDFFGKAPTGLAPVSFAGCLADGVVRVV